MILIVTNRQDQTADFLILELKSRKADYVRFNTEDFPNKVAMNWQIKSGQIDGYLTFTKRRIYLNEITSVGIEDLSTLYLLPKYLTKKNKISL